MKVGDLVQMKNIFNNYHAPVGFIQLGFITEITKDEDIWIHWFKDSHGYIHKDAILYSQDYCKLAGIHKVP